MHDKRSTDVLYGSDQAACVPVATVLQSMLFNLPATDPVTFAGVSALLIAIAVVACSVPARRATRIDPIATLRAE